MVLVEGEQERLPVQREAFAPGTIGELDFQLVLAGALCESLTGENEGLCGKRSIKVVDFDASTGTEGLPVCSSDCESATMKRIILDSGLRGKYPEIGVNGWGRH